MNSLDLTLNNLSKNKPLVAVSASSGLTAKLVEEAGFDAIWVSGFEVSALHGIPDNGTLTMSEMSEIVRQISEQTSLPIIVDCDEGYGNIHNAKRTAKIMYKSGAAGICLEDNKFPKKHSFWSKGQELETKENHGNKIYAIKQTYGDDLFVIGRTEALIRELGMWDACDRAKHYENCGADAILIHSRDPTGIEAREISEYFKPKRHLMTVPTKYPQMTTRELGRLGYDMVIWANHTLRLSLKAMREGLAQLKKADNAFEIENQLGSLEDIYSLTGVQDMEKTEEKYL